MSALACSCWSGVPLFLLAGSTFLTSPLLQAQAQEPESDGSWEDVSDEERQAERVARRRKGPLPPTGPVLEEIADAQPEAASASR